jgi:AraC family transcriptional regulator
MMITLLPTADICEESTARARIQRRASGAQTHYNQIDLRSDFAPWKSTARHLLDAVVQISPIDSVKRRSAERYGMHAESVYAPARTRIEFRFDAPVHLLVMYDDGVRRDGETSIAGLAPSRLRHFANKLTFVPANKAYYEWHETTTPVRMTFLYLTPAKLQKFNEVSAAYIPRAIFDDPVIWGTATKLRAEIEREKSESAPYLEALANVLGFELSRSGQELARTSTLNRGGLAGWQIRDVIGYIEEHLDETIALATLAQLARLSRYYFCRAFKQSFGIPPHQYQLQRRIQWAKVLLSDPANSITEVGLSLGYSQSSSFTVAFSKITGQTPSEFRRSFSRGGNVTSGSGSHHQVV